MLGRIRTIKTMLASLLVYKFFLLPTPAETILKALDKEFYSILWDGKMHLLNRNTMEMPYETGGFNMLNVFLQEKSIKFKWLQRLVEEDQFPSYWKCHVRECFDIDIKTMLHLNLSPAAWRKMLKENKILPVFWYSIFDAWFKFRFISGRNLDVDKSELLQTPIWCNSAIPLWSLRSQECRDALEDLNIVRVEDFIQKRHSCKEQKHIKLFTRTMPTHWQLLKPDEINLSLWCDCTEVVSQGHLCSPHSKTVT